MRQLWSVRSIAFLAVVVLSKFAPAQTLSPSTVAFASTIVGTSRGPTILVLANGSAGPLTISSISATGNFSETTNCPLAPKRLAPNGTCKIGVTFSPTILGPQTGVLSVTDNVGTSPQTTQLSGTGAAAVTLTPATLAFGNHFANTTSAAKTITLVNNQTVPLTITGISTSGDFAANSTCPVAPNSLAAKSSCAISVTFTPTALGARTGSLTVNDNAADTQQTAQLSGTGINPATLTPAALVFGGQNVATASAAKIITLKNVQGGPLTIFGIATSGDFARVSSCPVSPQTLAAGASCSISITFTPSAPGLRTGALTVSDSASFNTESASLTGTGTLTGLISIAITPGAPEAPAGAQLQLTATGKWRNGTLNITNFVTWSSAAPTIAQVNATGLVQAVIPGASNITATYGTVSAPAVFTVSAPVVTSITVSPSNESVPLGANQQFAALLNYNNGSSKDGTSVVSWSSSAAAVATLDNTGLATTAAAGSTTITALLRSISGSTLLTVSTPQCTIPPTGLLGWWTGDGDSVDIAGANSGMQQNGGGFGPGEVAQGFSFSGSGSSLLVNAPVYLPSAGTIMFWFLSKGGGVMTGSLAGANSRAPGLSIDTSGNLVWEFGNLSAQSLGHVSSNQWHHVALSYSSSASEATVSLYLDGNEISQAIATPNLDWYPQVAFGGYLGASATSFVGFMDEIAVFNQALSGQQVQQVYNALSGGMCKPTLQAISVSPANPSLVPGAVLQFTAAGTYSDSSTHDLTSSASWTSSNALAATMSATGVATGVAPGVTNIGAMLEGQTGSTMLNVGPSLVSIEVSPANPTIAIGTSQLFTATGTYSDGSQQNISSSVVWSTSSAVATITANGMATGVAPGQTTISAAVGSINGSALLTITSATLTALTVNPSGPTIAAGTTQQFAVTGTFSDSSTQDLSAQAQWSLSDSSVAAINTNGLVTSLVPGQITVTATFGGFNNSATLTVTAALLTAINVAPANASLFVGNTQQFAATGIFSDNSQQDLTGTAVWTSSNSNVASISPTGSATAMASGLSTVSATFNSTVGSTSLTVTNSPPALQSISISPASAMVAEGFSQPFTAQGTFTDGSMQDVTNLVLWSSSAPSIATVSNAAGSNGVATGAGVGGVTVNANLGSVVGTANLTVTAALLVSIEIAPGSSAIPPGGSSQFTAMGLFSDGSSSDITSSVSWTSSLPTVATISNTVGSQGLATSTGVGSTRISAAYNSLLDSTSLTIQDQLLSLSVSPASALVSPGNSQQFTAIGTYLSGMQQNLTGQVAWTTSNPAIAVVNSTGLAVSSTAGQTTIAATLGSLSSDANLGVTPIQHVIVIVQENRTPDNLFQDPNLINAGADIQNYGVNSTGRTIPLTPINLGTTGSNPDSYDVSHTHAAFVQMCNLNPTTNTCAMDGADKIQTTCNRSLGPCPPPSNPQFMYVKPEDVAPYFQMAETYTFADRMFQTNQGPSFPAHQFILSGTSAPQAGSDEFAADEPGGVASRFSGCVAPPLQYVELIDPSGVENQSIYPCFEHQTLTDLLDEADLSWRYYAPNITGIWTAPTAINHMCVPNAPPPNGTSCIGPDYTGSSPKVVLEQSQSNAQLLKDIATNQLAQVTWAIPPGTASDHAQSLGCGPSWVTSIVNAVGQSPYWSNTAIILTWDDWGGWYDHVAPPIINDGMSWGSGYIYGFRVPMVVISPYAKQAYISHQMHDFGSILKFVESTFNLPSLGYADVKADDLSDIFQYSQAPTAFTQITPPANNATCIGNPVISDPDDD